MKTFSIPSSLTLIVLGFTLLFSFLVIPSAFAEVFIPSHEYLGYFDSEGIYTVVGNVKNENPFAVIPTITVPVMDDETIHSKTIQHVPLAPGKEIPFKIKFFEVTGNTPVLMAAKLSYEKTTKEPIPIEILYDETLIKHKDGHITGRFQNTGTETIYYPKIYAVVQGNSAVLLRAACRAGGDHLRSATLTADGTGPLGPARR